jgi:hypothetical protein
MRHSGARGFPKAVIPGCALLGADPESRDKGILHEIPGSLALLAPRNDDM